MQGLASRVWGLSVMFPNGFQAEEGPTVNYLKIGYCRYPETLNPKP